MTENNILLVKKGISINKVINVGTYFIIIKKSKKKSVSCHGSFGKKNIKSAIFLSLHTVALNSK